MKKLFILFTFLSTVSYGQEFYLVPKELIDMVRESKVGPGLIQLKGQTLDTVIYADGSHYYLISSGDGNNLPGTKIRVQIKQVPMTDLIDTIDAVNSIFTGTWINAQNATLSWYGSTIEYSNTVNSTATFKHARDYRKVEIWSERKNTHGKIGISIDNGPEEIVDLYNPTHQIPYMIKSFDNLPLGIHEIKIRVTGEKNAASSNTYGIVDFYRFFR